jgi:DNA polymerase (family X)
MLANNSAVAQSLTDFARLLELHGENRFKVRAFRRAADTVSGLADNIGEMVTRGEDLTKLPGIGKAIGGIIRQIVNEGKLTQAEKLLADLSPSMRELATIQEIDPALIARIYKKLQLNSLAELRTALESGKIGEKFGKRTEFKLKRALNPGLRAVLLPEAEEMAAMIEKYLYSLNAVKEVAVSGQVRRKEEAVTVISFLIQSKSFDKVVESVTRFGAVKELISQESEYATFKLLSGTGLELFGSSQKKWGERLVTSTGNEEHLKLLSRLKSKKKVKDFLTEESLYESKGIDWVPPELRLGENEVTLAAKGKLPELVARKDIRGDLHCHTVASDGSHTIEHMVKAAQKLGYEYLSVSDHSQSLKLTNGLTPQRLKAQMKEIDRLNERLDGFRILKSSEIDILENGSLDYDESVLSKLDIRICSIHSRFGLDRTRQTDRILRAMENPYFQIMGHATGRLILSREPYDIDIEKIIKTAAELGCFFEINSSPDRLDLSYEHAKLAKSYGIKVAISTDAHSIAELNFIEYGLNQARRAGLEAKDVLNTLPVAKLLSTLKR